MLFSTLPLRRNSLQSLVGHIAQTEALRSAQTLWPRNSRIRSGSLTRHLIRVLCAVGFATTPLVNLALVVKNWGTAGAKLQINGQPVSRGSKFRYGRRHEMAGSSLLDFIQREATSPITIQLTPEHP